MRSPRSLLLSGLLCLFPSGATQGQAPAYANGRELLDAVARSYAAERPTFHFEWTTETVENREQLRSWRQSVYSAVKGSGGRFRLEARTPTGDWLQQSDGTTEWKFVREANVYEKHIAGSGPTFPRMYGLGSMELQQAWEVRKKLGSDAEKAKEATLGADEIVLMEGRAYPCYVVRATMKRGEYSGDETFWIEKQTLLVRKVVRHENTALMLSNTVHLPVHTDSTTLYPVAELGAETNPKLFSLRLPLDAKEVATLEPELASSAAPATTPPQLTGKLVSDITLRGKDGKPVKLSSFRGQPLVIDIWATWCGPCLTWMPALGRMEPELRSKGVRMISVDIDEEAETATRYMTLHNFAWPNFHDGDAAIGEELSELRIPLTLLLDKDGRVVYAGVDGNETALRAAVASLTGTATAAAP